MLVDKLRNLAIKIKGKFTPSVTLKSGAEVSGEEVARYRSIEKQWMKKHKRFWSPIKKKPFVRFGKPSQQSVEQAFTISKKKIGSRFNVPIKVSKRDISKFKTRKSFEKSIQQMEIELEKDFESARRIKYREDIGRNIGYYGDEDLTNMFNDLSDNQIEYLMTQTIFTESFFELVPSPKARMGVDIEHFMNQRISDMKKEIRVAMTK